MNKMWRSIVLAVALAAALALPVLTESGFWIKFAFATLLFAYMGQAWNILGGYAGQFSLFKMAKY